VVSAFTQLHDNVEQTRPLSTLAVDRIYVFLQDGGVELLSSLAYLVFKFTCTFPSPKCNTTFTKSRLFIFFGECRHASEIWAVWDLGFQV
jgi:hypothetical protein